MSQKSSILQDPKLSEHLKYTTIGTVKAVGSFFYSNAKKQNFKSKLLLIYSSTIIKKTVKQKMQF